MPIRRSALEVPRSATALAVTRVTRQSERVRLLTEDAYKATIGTPMTLVAPDDVRPLKLGDYVRSISGDDFEGHDFSSHDVEKVYRDPGARWIHVLVASRTPNVYLVIVVDEPGQSVYGHYVLDLNREYGIDRSSRGPRPPLGAD